MVFHQKNTGKNLVISKTINGKTAKWSCFETFAVSFYVKNLLLNMKNKYNIYPLIVDILITS